MSLASSRDSWQRSGHDAHAYDRALTGYVVHLARRGVHPYEAVPPVVRLLRLLGYRTRPPHALRPVENAVRFGLAFGTGMAAGMCAVMLVLDAFVGMEAPYGVVALLSFVAAVVPAWVLARRIAADVARRRIPPWDYFLEGRCTCPGGATRDAAGARAGRPARSRDGSDGGRADRADRLMSGVADGGLCGTMEGASLDADGDARRFGNAVACATGCGVAGVVLLVVVLAAAHSLIGRNADPRDAVEGMLWGAGLACLLATGIGLGVRNAAMRAWEATVFRDQGMSRNK